MVDERIKKHAKIIVDYSTKIKKGENVIISSSILAQDLVHEIYKLVLKKGAYASIKWNVSEFGYTFYKYANKDQLNKVPKHFFNEVEDAQVFISIIGDFNTKEMSNVDPKKISIRNKAFYKVGELISNRPGKMRRCLTIHPTSALAQEAGMSLEEFSDYVYDCVLQDWNKEARKMMKVKKYLDKVNGLMIVGKDTNLTMSIKGKRFEISNGTSNLPGGEIFCAPVRESLNGEIYFDYYSICSGKKVSDIKLWFKNGAVVKATASENQDFLLKMIKTDKNSKYVGELGIGLNKKINKQTNELLLDEKLGQTIHLALGTAYKSCGGGNDSAIHWDILKDMKKAKIFGDGKLIYKDGKWLV